MDTGKAGGKDEESSSEEESSEEEEEKPSKSKKQKAKGGSLPRVQSYSTIYFGSTCMYVYLYMDPLVCILCY